MHQALPACDRCAKLLRRLTLVSGMTLALSRPGPPMVQAEEVVSSPPWSVTAARPYVVRAAERGLWERLQLFLDQQQWNDALDAATRLLGTDSHAVVAVDKDHYVSLREVCHRRLAQLPAQAIARYRRQVDATAAAWYRQAVARRDQPLLERIVDEMFCSSWGDDALLALGELALQRGNYQSARTYWERISPRLRAPNGLSMVSWLRKHGPADPWQSISPTTTDAMSRAEPKWLAYPDTDLNLAEVRARLALVSIREADFARAELEIAWLAALHPKAQGRLGGRKVVYAQRLAELLTESRAQTVAAAAVSQTPPSYEKLWSHALAGADRQKRRQPTIYPIAVGDWLVYQDASSVHTLRLSTGQPAFAAKKVAFAANVADQAEATGLLIQPRYALTASDGRVFGTTVVPGRPPSGADKKRAATTLWGIDLQREGALCFRQPSDDVLTALVATPVVEDSHLCVASRSRGLTGRIGLACYDLGSRGLRWRRKICRTNPPANPSAQGQAVHGLTYDGGIVYLNTNLGIIAAVRADDGQLLWIQAYAHDPTLAADAVADASIPNPCLYQHGMLFVLPHDSRELFALDAATGLLVWKRPLPTPQGQIIGVVDDHLLVASGGLQVVQLQSGEIVASNTDVSLVGQAVVVGKQVVWPGDDALQWMDAATAKKMPLRLPLPESGGANLLVAGAYLAAAGRSRMTVFRSTTITATNADAAPASAQVSTFFEE